MNAQISTRLADASALFRVDELTRGLCLDRFFISPLNSASARRVGKKTKEWYMYEQAMEDHLEGQLENQDTEAMEQDQASEPLVIEDCAQKRPEETEANEVSEVIEPSQAPESTSSTDEIKPVEDAKDETVEGSANIDTGLDAQKSADSSSVVESVAEEPAAESQTADSKDVTESATGTTEATPEATSEPASEPKEEFHVALDATGEPKLETVVEGKSEPATEITPVEEPVVPEPEPKPEPVLEESVKEEPVVQVDEVADDAVASDVSDVSDVSDEPEEIRQWRKDGTHKARVYTYDKLGFHLVTEDHGTVDPKQIAKWEATMNEYFAAHPTESN